MEDVRYPIGRFDWDAPLTSATRASAVRAIATLPSDLRAALAGLDDAQRATQYKPGGWTVTQVVHHLADSHLNGFARVKFGLTEERPTVQPYDQDKWAVLSDTALSADVSLRLLEALHERWAALLGSMSDADFQRPVNHVQRGTLPLDQLIHLYGWHSRHHVGHITALRARQGW